jgi:hypothetical protein
MRTTMDVNTNVDEYIRTRDEIRDIESRHKDELRPYKQKLEELGAVLLEQLQAVGGDGVRTKSGTVYVTEKRSASLADPSLFMDYVIQNSAWDLLDRKANVTAVTDYIAEHNAAPPGVNFSAVLTVGVRRK